MTSIARHALLVPVLLAGLGLSACKPSGAPAAGASPASAASQALATPAAPASSPSGQPAAGGGTGTDAALALPASVKALLPKSWQVLAVSQGDLDKDGQDDFAIALEAASPLKEGEQAIEAGARRLLLVTRQADGSHKVQASSDAALLCKDCGGAMGDPFSELKAGSGVFTITHYGGSSLRWGHTAEFRWSRKDQAWQLVRFEETSFNANEPNSGNTSVMKPPKDFGKIDFTDFDPENVKGQGER